MKKELIKKFIVISLISLIFSMIGSINIVQATASNSENTIQDETSEEKIMMYDVETNTTTEIDVEAIRKSRNEKGISNSTNTYNKLNRIDFSRKVDTYATYSNSMTRINNTSSFPNRATCRIMESAGQNTIGTAALVGPKIALTAAHCVFDMKTKETIKNWTILPGYNNGNYYGTKTGWSKVIYSSKWMSSGTKGDNRYDWAICILGHNLGTEVGSWYEAASYGSNKTDFSKLNVRVLGYPSEKENSMTTGQFQYETGGDVKSVNDTNFTYDGWTVKGFSGGPIRRTNDNFIVGVHFGATDTNVPKGVRMTQEMIDIIREYRSK